MPGPGQRDPAGSSDLAGSRQRLAVRFRGEELGMFPSFWSCGGEYLSRLTSSLYYLVVGQRFQLNNTEWSVRRKTAGARNRARSASKRYQAAWNDQCSLVWTAVGGSVCGGSNAAGPSIWLIQTEQTQIASIYRIQSGGVFQSDPERFQCDDVNVSA